MFELRFSERAVVCHKRKVRLVGGGIFYGLVVGVVELGLVGVEL